MTDFPCKKSCVILKYEGKKLTEKTETFERREGTNTTRFVGIKVCGRGE